ncbi:DUF5908 family protein [Dyadobacter arcticus]|uniref:Uncharacterized protein n=1 Tax=Dyadobacter arcticus TaxID=1078754 RepID=A0ABX0UQL3_9BACT|nr:DUF5908 family protein [Dyadobacter arcticus]NIJ54703.1 hypothetical protein [Dyadobacter arcticus]
MAVHINEVVVKATVCEEPRNCAPENANAGAGGGGASAEEIVERVLEIIRNSEER